MKILISLITLPVLFYVIICLYIFFNQKRMMYMPFREMEDTPDDIDLPYRKVSIETADGVRLSGWFVGEHENADVALFCHGNAGNISHRLETFKALDSLGLNTFIFDYRGYGASEGSPTEKGTHLDAEAAWRYLTETEKISPDRIILWGRSLGGAVATKLATKVNAKGLVLESTFTSIPEVGAAFYPYLPVKLFARYKYNTEAIIATIDMPVLVVHSPEDEVIYYRFGKRLFEAAVEPKQFLKIQGSHNEGFVDSKNIYINGVKEFLESLMR